jgi:hypothetical protein
MPKITVYREQQGNSIKAGPTSTFGWKGMMARWIRLETDPEDLTGIQINKMMMRSSLLLTCAEGIRNLG